MNTKRISLPPIKKEEIFKELSKRIQPMVQYDGSTSPMLYMSGYKESKSSEQKKKGIELYMEKEKEKKTIFVKDMRTFFHLFCLREEEINSISSSHGKIII